MYLIIVLVYWIQYEVYLGETGFGKSRNNHGTLDVCLSM